ncbi:MBL fold metallo-hydrolase [Patescibacteria group bacterium]|nr:MBL fold metallo-hydrolase [Patescibacteria group bacterium]
MSVTKIKPLKHFSVTFLGTGSSVGIPREGHTDALCVAARKGGKSRRLRSAALVECGSTQILIDAGPDILEQLRSVRPDKLKAVLLTHGHSDAFGGIAKLDKWLHHRLSGVRFPVFTDEITSKRLSLKLKNPKSLDFIQVKTLSRIHIGDFAIVPFPVEHSRDERYPTRGYFFGKSLAYASDACEIPAASKALLAGVSTFVLDGTMYFGRSMYSHLSIEQAIEAAYALKVSHLVLTQIGHSFRPHAEAQKTINAYLEKQNLRFPKRVTLAYDRLRLSF